MESPEGSFKKEVIRYRFFPHSSGTTRNSTGLQRRISKQFCDSGICLARLKEYSSSSRKGEKRAKEKKEDRNVETRRHFSRVKENESDRSFLASEGATIISPPVVAPFRAAPRIFLGPRGCVLFFISKPDTLHIGGEGMGGGEGGRNGAKIETHRGERYKWDVGPGTR